MSATTTVTTAMRTRLTGAAEPATAATRTPIARSMADGCGYGVLSMAPSEVQMHCGPEELGASDTGDRLGRHLLWIAPA